MITNLKSASCDECRNPIPVADATADWPAHESVAHWRREVKIERADPCRATVDLDLCRECRGRITLTELIAICERRAKADLKRQEELANAVESRNRARLGASYAPRAEPKKAKTVAEKLVAAVEGMTPGPGQSVLALMLAARALCAAFPALPAFEWYFRRVSELRSRVPPERDPPS